MFKLWREIVEWWRGDEYDPMAVVARERAEWEAYKVWRDQQVCSGCGKSVREATADAPFVTETICWRCHFGEPYKKA